MVFDYAVRRWARLDDVSWDAAQSRLVLYHLAKAGVPEREYVAAPAGDRLQGTFTEAGAVRLWQVDRVLPHGAWQPTLPFGPFALNNAGKWEAPEVPDPDAWTGRLRTPSPGTIFLPLEHAVPMDVSWDGTTLTVNASVPHTQTLSYHPITLEATMVTRLSMSGTVTASGGFPGLQPGLAWQATRFDDGIPF